MRPICRVRRHRRWPPPVHHPLSFSAGSGTTSKLYQFTGDGLALSRRGSDIPDPFGPSILYPITSGDGSLAGSAIYYACRTGSCGMAGFPRTFFTIEAAGLDRFPANSMQVSRNGRFLLWNTHDGRLNRMELPSRQITGLGQFLYYPAGRQSLANTGAVLANGPYDAPRLRIFRDGAEPAIIPSSADAGYGVLSPGASRVAFERPTANGFELLLADAPFTVQRRLAVNPQRLYNIEASFANDGTLLYLAPDAEGRLQPAIATTTGETLPLAHIPEGAAVQIPWELPSLTSAPHISLSNPGSPFVQTVPFSLLDLPTISFERTHLNNWLQAVHQDFRGIVTPADPPGAPPSPAAPDSAAT